MYLEPKTKMSRACEQFFNFESYLRLPYRHIDLNGYVIECNDLRRPQPFGVSITVEGMTEIELDAFKGNDKTFSDDVEFNSAELVKAANRTCFGNCTKSSAGKTAKVLSYNAHLLQGTQLHTLKLVMDFKSTDSRAEEVA